MAVEVVVDPALLALIIMAMGLAVTVEYLAILALQTGVGSIPVIGDAWDWLWSHIKTYAVDAENALIRAAGNVWSSFLDNLFFVFGIAAAIAYLLGEAVYAALHALWTHTLPALIASIVNPIRDIARKAEALATTAESDAQAALSQVEHVVTATIPDAIRAVERDAAKLADTAYTDAVSYADTAVAKLKAAEDAAVASAVQLAATAEHDAVQAYKDATAYVDTLVKPIGVDLSDFEAYVKSLGLPGAIAAVTALSAVLTATLAETGLENAACRSKVKGICGTDPTAWVDFLAGIAAIGIAFDFREFVALLQDLIQPVESLVKQAA